MFVLTWSLSHNYPEDYVLSRKAEHNPNYTTILHYDGVKNVKIWKKGIAQTFAQNCTPCC
nr:hypothetical protein HHOCTOMJ_HHOCTOMJ_CDS_0002 [Microvirus sp.]